MPIYENYTFYPKKDSIGNDACFIQSSSLDIIKNICDSNDNFLAFNTYGYIKFAVTHENYFCSLNHVNKHYPSDGIYIKNTKNKNIPVTIYYVCTTNTHIEKIKEIFLSHKISNCNFFTPTNNTKPKHYNLWQNISENHCLILDNGIKFSEKFGDKIKYICNMVKNMEFDVIHLGYSQFNEHSIDNTDKPKIKYFDANNFKDGMYAYIISRNGARKFMQYVDNNAECIVEQLPIQHEIITRLVQLELVPFTAYK